jgi:hypothetical protein
MASKDLQEFLRKAMSDQRKTAYTCNEPAANVRNNGYEIQGGLGAEAQQRDNHDRTGSSPETHDVLPLVSGLRPSERLKRELAVRFAKVSVGLEGFVPSRKTAIDAQRFIEGHITLSEFVGAK